MKKNTIVAAAVWAFVVICSLVWNLSEAIQSRERLSFQTARSFFDQIVITRKWNAMHGGVYVPITGQIESNPYLDTPDRDIRIDANRMLTKINPAYMTRLISEIAATEKGIQFHITSMDPIRPQNAPSALEERALKAFQNGKKEFGLFMDRGPDTRFFYMAPLITEKPCLVCHARQGYEEGDIRGGISVTLPFVQSLPVMSLVGGHLLIGLAGIVCILFFGRKLEAYTEILQRQSVIDALTGIPNRRSFSETILHEFRRASREKKPLSVIMCDIDRFKDYNDCYGHAAGDACLTKVAIAIREALRRAGDFCARYGGEEFVIILPDTASPNACHIAENIRKKVQDMGIVHERSLPLQVITLSLGIATMEVGKNLSDEVLIRQADQALYLAKNQGRNRYELYCG
ncbi:MAG: diguanylate cyclase [Desulfatirhabdiaceae bacterium]